MRVILARIRERAHISQTQVSQDAGISQGYYSDIECGVRCPSPEVAVRIARVLKISESEIFRVFYSEDQRRQVRIKSAAKNEKLIHFQSFSIGCVLGSAGEK